MKPRDGIAILGGVGTIAGLLLFLLSFLLASCGGTPIRARMILPAEDADVLELLPDGRHFHYAGKDGPRILDVATGEEVLVPEVSSMQWIGDGLFRGVSGNWVMGQGIYYIINWPSLSAVRLEELVEEDLPARIQEANLFYAFGSIQGGKYQLLILDTDPSGQVVRGYHIDGVKDPQRWLGGRSYETSTLRMECDWKQQVPSPDGRYYYDYVRGASLRIYSQDGELVNSISATGLNCYGWAWDSSGVYVQERRIGLFVMNPYFGPLLLLQADR